MDAPPIIPHIPAFNPAMAPTKIKKISQIVPGWGPQCGKSVQPRIIRLMIICYLKNGGTCGIRTHDKKIKSLLLYQLS